MDRGRRSPDWDDRRAARDRQNGGLLFEQVIDANYRSGSALKQVDDPADGYDGPNELHHVDVEAGELSDRNTVLDNFMTSDEKGDHQGETQYKLKRRPQHCH